MWLLWYLFNFRNYCGNDAKYKFLDILNSNFLWSFYLLYIVQFLCALLENLKHCFENCEHSVCFACVLFISFLLGCWSREGY